MQIATQNHQTGIIYTGRIPEVIQSQIDDFYNSPFKEDNEGKATYRGGSPRKEECEIIARIMLKLEPQKTIDWGLGDAAVCTVIALVKNYLGLNKKHISLDPFQHSISKDVGLIQLKHRGLEGTVDFREDRSEDFLVEAAKLNHKFDFIFVDGDHTFSGKVTDAHLADKVLNPGGVIAFHDSLFKSTSAAVSSLIRDRKYQIIPLTLEPAWKVMARSVRHAPRLGFSYASKIIPHLGISIACLRKPLES